MFDWIYLVWYGRYPFRVTQIVYLAELVLLVAIIINHELWARKSAATDSDVNEEKDVKEEKGFNKILKDINKTVKVNPVYILMIALLIFSGFRFGIPVMKSAKDQIKAFRKMSVCFTELEDYLEAHPDNFYFFDMSHLYYTEDTLRFKKAEYENYVYMGSWMPLSPWYNHKLESYGITDPDNDLLNKDNVYILYQTVDFDTREFLDKYFTDHEELSSIEVIDTFTSSNGFNYEILKPIDNNNLTTE